MPNSSCCLALAEDVLLEIFVRLPFGSICKFRCVSKAWLSLLSNPIFINMIFNKLMKDGIIPWAIVRRHSFNDYKCKFNSAIHKRSFFSTSSTNLYHELLSSRNLFSFESVLDSNVLKQEETDIFLLASSNGLVLCLSKEYSPGDYFIYNPFTSQCVSLPLPRPNSEIEGVTGFVFEPSTQTYKVIHVQFSHLSSNFNIQIFSSDASEWVTREVTWSYNVEMHINNHLHIVNHDGVWYWIHWIECGKDIMIAYDDKNDGGVKWKLLNLPSRRNVSLEQQCLGVSQGHLCYGKIERKREVSTVSVWVLPDDNESFWKMMYKVTDIQDYICVPPWRRYFLIGFCPEDQNVLIFECLGDGHQYEVLKFDN
ncbi:F-box protein At5g07610-like [Papaver somniferum]|uniref:F-box protein At5g07610-like n=1 Tax=Papaver somniferum TaxID=3469 RepID=UPI000E6FA5B6|nr:F-box protein At5g07610-like [Papaver somniferum]